MQSVQVAPKGTSTVGLFGTAQADLFGPEAKALSLRARQVIAQGFEVGLAASHISVDAREAADGELSRHLVIGRLNGKWAPFDNYIAFDLGVGSGTSAAGQFIAPDLGLVLAYENPYLIPFLNLSGFLSQPINAQAVDVSRKDDGLGTHVLTPKLTWGTTWSVGLKLPLTHSAGLPVAPYAGLTGTLLDDGDMHTRFVGFTAGIDVSF